MRRINSLFKSKSIEAENIQQFPNHLLRMAPWGQKCFLFVVDPELGNDSNDGFSLHTAKKTIQAALDMLPKDLQGYEAGIYLHPGVYETDGDSVMLLTHRNGTIKFHCLGLSLNSPPILDDPNYVLLTDSGKALVRNNGQIVFTSKNLQYRGIIDTLWNGDKSLSVYFYSSEFYLNWNDPASQSAYKIKIAYGTGCSNSWLASFSFLRYIEFQNPFELDVTNCEVISNRSLYFGKCASGRIAGIKLTNTSEIPVLIQTKTGAWEALIVCEKLDKNFSIENVWFPSNAWHPDYPLPAAGVQTLVNGARQLIGLMSSGINCTAFSNMIYNQAQLPDSNPPNILIDSNCSGVILSYHSDRSTLTNLSGFDYKITDSKTGQIITAVANYLRRVGSSTVLSSHNAAIADSDLLNKEMNFWLDEANNKLMVKIKKSDGTVKNGEIALI